jgi:hypothetical protein
MNSVAVLTRCVLRAAINYTTNGGEIDRQQKTNEVFWLNMADMINKGLLGALRSLAFALSSSWFFCNVRSYTVSPPRG